MNPNLRRIKKLIKRKSKEYTCTMNIAVPIRGKDQIGVPIPFKMNFYIVENRGDWSWREPAGDSYDTEITIYSLSPISVLSETLKETITFGFLNSNFTLIYKARTYRITEQRCVNEDYYVMKGTLSV